jgi:hypothetical protein
MLNLVKAKQSLVKASNSTMAEQPKSEASQLNQVRSLQELRQRWLKVLFSLFLLLLSGLWLYEAWILGKVNPIDRLAYPLMLGLISSSLAFLQINPGVYKISLIGTVGVIAVYQFLILQAIIWGYIPASRYLQINHLCPVVSSALYPPISLLKEKTSPFSIRIYLSLFRSRRNHAKLDRTEITCGTTHLFRSAPHDPGPPSLYRHIHHRSESTKLLFPSSSSGG